MEPIDTIRKAPHDIAGIFSHLTSRAAGDQAGVPSAPDEEAWEKYLKGYTESVGKGAEHDIESEKTKERAEKANADVLEQTAAERKYKQGFYKRMDDLLTKFDAIDWSKPDAKKTADDLRYQMSWVNEALTGKAPSTGKLSFATGKMAEAVSLGGGDPTIPISMWDEKNIDAMNKGYGMLESKTTTRSGSTTDPYGLHSQSSTTSKTQLGGGAPAKPAPGGGKTPARPSGPAGAVKGTPPPKPTASENSVAGKLYFLWAESGNPPKSSRGQEAARMYGRDHNLPDPATVSPADRKSLSGLSNLEATFPDLVKYADVLKRTVSRIKLQHIVSSVMKPAGQTGVITGVEGLFAAGLDAALVKSLSPEEQKFLLAYNQARESVQTLRQFAGVSRSTQALYNALASLIPNPAQTKDSAMARKQVEALENQIKTIRHNLLGASEGDKKAQDNEDIPGFIPSR